MQRRHRLTAKADFVSVRQRGRSFPGHLLVLYAGQNADLPLRIGLSVGKQFGSAVARNRFKRRIRDIVRRRLGLLAPGWDIIFVARSSARTAPFGELESAVDGALRRAGILASTRGDPGEVGR